MIEKATNSIASQHTDSNSFKKLSIQIGLNGLSFFVLDTLTNTVLLADKIVLSDTATPYLLQKSLKEAIEKYRLKPSLFSEVSVIHQNSLFTLVPKPLFEVGELANYLKFNAKLLANDEVVYDELKNQGLVCVYVPFTNINNLLFELFGEFEYKHLTTVVLQTLFNQKPSMKKVCYAHVSDGFFELAVFDQKKMLFYNQFEYNTKEDFLYYILFTYEQLELNTESVKLKLFGAIEEGDELYNICYDYIKKVVVFEPKTTVPLNFDQQDSIDLTLLSSF